VGAQKIGVHYSGEFRACVHDSAKIRETERRMPKQVVYRFNANPKDDRVKLDTDDEISEPTRGDVLEIHGKKWKVNMVIHEHSLSAKGPIAVMTIYLTDN
jgi:hypothetical protein